MRILHWLEISNFKSYGTSGRIPLDHPSVLIGPNNCGKTTALQAIALWSIAVRTWQQESKDSKAKQRTGKPLNRLTILSVPVPKTRHFWKNLKVSGRGRGLHISVGVEIDGSVEPVTMVFRHHASDELIYAEPHPSTASKTQALERAARLDVALLYPMSGIASDEPLITRNRIDYHMGRGSTAEVLRNLCLVVQQDNPSDWQEITALMQRLFQVSLTTPRENEGGSLDLFYEQRGADRPLDLSLAGRGFQQMLLILAHLYSHKGSVLLIDEPDAHLEILRQQQIYTLLDRKASIPWPPDCGTAPPGPPIGGSSPWIGGSDQSRIRLPSPPWGLAPARASCAPRSSSCAGVPGGLPPGWANSAARIPASSPNGISPPW